jgi:hypothetical protein
MLGVLPGVLNDPHNLSLRRAILAYGTGHVCDEVRSHSMPLRFRDEDPVAGRFFPAACAARDLPGGDLQIQLGGLGYVWTGASLRLGFEAGASVAYDTDFLMDGSTMYVYFRPRAGAPPAFATRFVEQPQAAFLSGMLAGPGGQSFTNGFGAQIMQGQLARGFTVIRRENGSVAVGVGVIPPGRRPPEAYLNLDPDRVTLANERSEIHANQRDFVGPLEVPSGRRLDLTLGVSGVPAVRALVVPRAVGDAWLATYVSQAAPTPPPGPPLLDEAVTAGPIYRRSLPVAPGAYYLVLDNAQGAPAGPDPGAVVSYAVALE